MILGRSSSGAIKIKTDGGLRAVSCGCCGGCLDYLLYPGHLMNVKFDHNDLPNSLLFVDYQLGDQLEYFSLQKINPFFTKSYNGDGPSGTFYYKTQSQTDPYTGAENFKGIAIASGENYWDWAIYIGPGYDEDSESPTEYGIQYDSGSQYAFDYNYLCSEAGLASDSSHFWWMFDQFADTLTVTENENSEIITRGVRSKYPPELAGLPNTPMVLPFTECKFGPDDSFLYPVIGKYKNESNSHSLYFDYVINYTPEDIIIVSDSCKWKLKTPSGTFTKIGYGNTPIGTYSDGSMSITIS